MPGKLKKLLLKNQLTLIVDLPENDLALASMALSAGADALQLNLNGAEGSWEHDLSSIFRVREDVPVGLFIGRDLSEKEFVKLSRYPFDFINIDIGLLAGLSSKLKKFSRIVSLNEKFSISRLLELEGLGADVLDAAIISPSGKGHQLLVGDLQNYIAIVMSAGISVIIPTQRKIHLSEVPIIWDTGAKGLLLTPVVIGNSAKSIERSVKEFRIAVDDLG